MSALKTILVAGSANLDFVVQAAHIPAPGQTVLGRSFQTFPGGKGANQAVACARAGGVATRMLLALGDDAFAAPIEASLRSAGVELFLIRKAAQPTGVALICVADDGENAITVAPGANALLSVADLPSLAGVSHLLLQLEIPLSTVLAYAAAARAAGVAVVLNAAPAQALPAELLALVDILVVNEGELAAVAKVQGTLAQRMASVAVPMVVTTLGASGCCALVQGRWWTQPAYAVAVLDTTAAGDTFCGMLVAALSHEHDQGQGFQAALALASAAAALACTQKGAQASIPTRAQVEAFMRAQPLPAPHQPPLQSIAGEPQFIAPSIVGPPKGT